MKYISEYGQLFENTQDLTQEQKDWLDKCSSGTWRTWNVNPQTGLVDVDWNFDCSKQDLTDFKGVRFGKVGGSFYCNRNELTTLEGAPQTVKGYFRCDWNQLTTLEGAPQTVKGDFSCERNQLTSLEGAPQTVGVHFYCSNNQITTLEGAPQTVGGDFHCYDNKLTTLEGAPQTVGGNFICYNNPVSGTTLKAIFALMKKGRSYEQALEEYWPKMADEDRVLMYKQMPNLSPEDARKYKALATYNNIKDYL